LKYGKLRGVFCKMLNFLSRIVHIYRVFYSCSQKERWQGTGTRTPLGHCQMLRGTTQTFFIHSSFSFFFFSRKNRRTGTGTCVAVFLFEFGFDEAN